MGRTQQEADKLMAEIRQGLTQFVGAMLINTSYEGQEARQIVCASLVEEALALTRQEDKYEMFSAKPIIRATVAILQERKTLYEESINTAPAAYRQQFIDQYQETEKAINYLQKFIT